MNTRRQSQVGAALIVALLAVVVVAGIGMLMFTRTLNEVRHSGDDARIVQTLMLARGGANVGGALMVTEMKDALYPAVFATSSPGRWTYGKDAAGVNSEAPDPVYVAQDLKKLAARAQTAVDALVCGVDALQGEATGAVAVRVFFTNSACSGTFALPSDVVLPDGRYVSGPARVVNEDGDDVGIQEYALPYVLVSEATVGDYRRNIVVQGEYVFSVGEAPFSHYAYFTNRESADGGRIYFTDNTLIDGPTHTNGHFSIHKTPWFGGDYGGVTSAGCQFNTNKTVYQNTCVNSPDSRSAGVYFNTGNNGTFVKETNMKPSNTAPVSGIHAPEFTAGIDWQASYVPLPTNSINQRRVAQGIGAGSVLRDDQGIIFEHDLDSLTLRAGDVNGVSPTWNSATKSWTPAATYQYVTAFRVISPATTNQVCTGYGWNQTCKPVTTPAVTETISYRFNEDNILELLDASGNWVVQSKPFNGVIYVDGKVERLKGSERRSGTPYNNQGKMATPAVASFAMMTIVSPKDIRITSDLRYEQPPCEDPLSKANKNLSTAQRCTNLTFDNVLGVFSSGGDVKIGNENNDSTLNAPSNLFIDAVLMSGQNQVRVENYSKGSSKGVVNLLGGMIQENRGIFGQVGGPGYDRVYTYDPRMRKGLAPPFFPTTGIGEVQSVRYFSFGQREQLY